MLICPFTAVPVHTIGLIKPHFRGEKSPILLESLVKGIETAYRFSAVDPPNCSWQSPLTAPPVTRWAAGTLGEEKLMNFLKVVALPSVERSMQFAEVYMGRGELVIS